MKLKIKVLFLVFCLVTSIELSQAPLVLQPLDYKEILLIFLIRTEALLKAMMTILLMVL